MDPTKAKPNVAQEERTTIPESITPPDTSNDFDELDALANEMNKFKREDDFDRAYDITEGSDEAEEEIETPEGEQEEAIDPAEVEGQESEQEAPEGSEEAEEDAEGEEEPEEEIFYDTERDFPGEKVAPTVYKDRVALNSGVSAKINYARELVEKLEGMESNLGAIDLPEIFNGQEEFVKQPFDREAFLDVDNDSAKKAAFQLDKFINSVKNKVSRVEGEYNVTQEKEQVTQEYQTAIDNVAQSLEVAGIPIHEATQLTQAQIEGRVMDQIKDFKENKFDELYTERGVDAANAELDKLYNALDTIKGFPEIAVKYQKVAEKKAPQEQQVTNEQMKSSFDELAQDRPDLEMFQGKTDAAQRDFLEYVRLKIQRGEAERPGTARSWLNLYKDHQSDRKAEYERFKSRKTPDQGNKIEGKKPNQNKRPPVNKVRNLDMSDAKSPVSDIDAELDELAKELNQQ